MATKKKDKTFAERAKKIIKKYPRAEWDNIEKEQLDRELAELAQEQEEYKRANKIGEYSDEAQQEQQMQQQLIQQAQTQQQPQ